jgi:hypothetical protein
MTRSIEQLIAALQPDERLVAEAVLRRLDQGRAGYGPWRLNDGRDYPEEALAEVIDALHYCAAELVRLRRARPALEQRRRRVYVCHPYRGAHEANLRRVTAICRALVERGFLPIAPHLYLPSFVDPNRERDLAIGLCLDLISTCDELWAYGNFVTSGMHCEIERAKLLGLPVRFIPEAA